MRPRLPVRTRSCGVRRGDGRACDSVRTVRACSVRPALVSVRRSSHLSSTWTWNQKGATARGTHVEGTATRRACWTPCDAAGDVEAAPRTTPQGRWPSGSSRLVCVRRVRDGSVVHASPSFAILACTALQMDSYAPNEANGMLRASSPACWIHVRRNRRPTSTFSRQR